MKVKCSQISQELISEAKESLKDNIVTQEEYNRLEKIALKDNKLDRSEQLFIASLDNKKAVKSMKSSNFNPNNCTFNVSERFLDKPALIVAKTSKKPLIESQRIVRQIDNNQTLDKNLKNGKEVCEFVIKKIESVNKFDSLSNSWTSIKNFLPQFANRVQMLGATYDNNGRDKPPSKVKNPDVHYSEVSLIGHISLKNGVGNCGEKASLAALMLANRGVSPVEVFTIPGHAFTVIGRDLSSDPSDPTTWGNTAVIVDPWRENVSPVQEISRSLKKSNPSILYQVIK